MSKLAKLIAVITLSILGFSLLAPIQPTFADDSICNNDHVKDEIKAASGCPGFSPEELPDVVERIIYSIIFIVGIIAVIFIIIGGIQYMTSTGDVNKIQKAKHTIMYAVIGLIICILAFAITNFIIRISS